jgi:hypothetical protein
MLGHAIIGPPQASHHLSEGMRLAALRHTEMVEELATLQATVSSVVESVLGCSPNNIFYTEVVGELAAEFQKMEEWRSRLERPASRICDLLPGPPFGRPRLADCLDEAVRQLRVDLAARQEADAELEDLWTSAAWVWYLALDNADGPSSFLVYMSMAAEMLEGRIDAATANGVWWGSRSVLVAAVSHFLDPKTELEVLRSGRNVNLTEDEADAIWTRVRVASDSLALYVPSSATHNPPDSVGE